MSAISLVNQAVLWYAASGVLAFIFTLRKPLSGAIARDAARWPAPC